jgi:hypothetical protein
MRYALSSILLFLVIASLALACEAVTHANDFGTASTEVSTCATGTLSCGGSCVPEDTKNCGSCGVSCESTQVCSNGICGSQCNGGTTQCPSPDGTNVCVDTQNDPANCGRCGGEPDSGTCPICQDGLCRSTCLGGKFCAKSKRCEDTATDPQNCGDCDHVCPTGQFCSSGSCTGSCGPNEQACGQSCVDLQSDPNNCSACNKPCASPGANGVPVCVGGLCRVSCNAPVANQAFTVCVAGASATGGGSNETTYTCADLQVDPNNCGKCGTKCVCAQGACAH